jgi:hypothetical protein
MECIMGRERGWRGERGRERKGAEQGNGKDNGQNWEGEKEKGNERERKGKGKGIKRGKE